MSKDKVKTHRIKREWSNPFFVHFKKHYCPHCNTALVTRKDETIVNSMSEESKNFDFSLGDSFSAGNVKFIRTVFYCSKCDKTYSIKETRENDFLIGRWK